MALRVLVEEKTSPRIVDRLRDAGHEAVHVLAELGEGAAEAGIVDHAERHGYVIPTHDDDFLSLDRSARACYYADDTVSTAELADRVVRLGSAVRSNDDLGDATYLGGW